MYRRFALLDRSAIIVTWGDFVMAAFIHLTVMLAAIAFPFVAMPLLWRRMKRVRDQSSRSRELEPHQQPWEERLESHDGFGRARVSNPNDELLSIGEKARQSRWPLDNP
jgi:hypothetical protein